MSKTVVLIDDDEDDLEFLKETLESIDASLCCICFSSPVEALQAISNRMIAIPSFVFTDVNMPRMRGEEVVQELRKRQEYNKTIITVSSTSMPEDVSKNLKNMGANYTFKKPSSLSMLQRMVEPILVHQSPSQVTEIIKSLA